MANKVKRKRLYAETIFIPTTEKTKQINDFVSV